MIIPIDVTSNLHDPAPKLPPGLAKISHNEVVLIELQGSLEVNQPGERDGKLVGKLKLDEGDVRLLFGSYPRSSVFCVLNDLSLRFDHTR